jgi:hypothetical protein
VNEEGSFGNHPCMGAVFAGCDAGVGEAPQETDPNAYAYNQCADLQPGEFSRLK